MKDIFEVLFDTRAAFIAAGFESPAVITLATHDDGMKLLMTIQQRHQLIITSTSQQYGIPIEGPDGTVWMEIELMGLKIRWPANRMAFQDGRSRWY